MIYVIEDDELMAECLARACAPAPVRCFGDAIAAVQALADQPPTLIFLDILLTGPDGFTFLNELVSYRDTAQIPVVLVSFLDLRGQDLSAYGVVATLDKSTFTPADVRALVEQHHVA